MAQFVWGIDPLAASRAGQQINTAQSPLSRAALQGMGIPPRKLERVQTELARLAQTGGIDPASWPDLALEIAGQLL